VCFTGPPMRRPVKTFLLKSHLSFKPHAPLRICLQMGEVLEESARIALSWIRAHAGQLPLLPADACGEPHPSEAALGAGDGPGAGAEVMRAAGAPSAPGAAGPTCWDVHVHLPAGAVPKVACARC